MANLNRYGKNAWKVAALNWAARLAILAVIGAALFFGYKKLAPVISDKVEEWRAAMASKEEETESGEENNGIGTALPQDMELAPVYHWDFSVGMEEQISGVSCTPCGDARIVEMEDPGAPVKAALYLDGDGDYIDCGKEIQFDRDFTLNALVNCSDVNRDYTAIIGKYETEGEGPLVLAIRQGHVNCWVISDIYKGDFEGGKILEPDTWYDITVVYEQGQMRIYVDGMFDGQEDVGILNANEDTITIGRQAALHDSDEEYVGYIGKITVYNKAMTPEEVGEMAVANLYPQPEGGSGMLMTVTAGALNVRTEPSTSGDIVAELRNGEKVEVLGDPSDDWIYIRCIEQNNEEGYASAKYLAPADGQ